MTSIRLFGLSTLAMLSLACDGSTSGPPHGIPAFTVVVDPPAAAVTLGASFTFTATVLDGEGQTVTHVPVSWSTGSGTIASVANGVVTAIGTGTTRVIASIGEEADSAAVVVHSAGAGDVVSVIPSLRLQQMRGWEAVAQAGQMECPGFASYRDELFDRAVDELGLNRIRLEVYGGIENPVDFHQQFVNGQISFAEWLPLAQTAVNDNDSPTQMNPLGFHFGSIEATVEDVVLPLRQRLQARGERLYVNLNFVDFTQGSFEHRDSPEEYAEFMVAVVTHLWTEYNLEVDAVEVALEPDLTGWTGQMVGRALVAAGDRLANSGFRPDFVGPSTTSTQNAVTFFDQMVAVPRVLLYLKTLSYHRYQGATLPALQAIGARAAQPGLSSAMLEHIGSGYEDLLTDLTVARVSAWQQFALAFCTSDDGSAYYLVDGSNPGAPQVRMSDDARYLSQFFRYVRLDAVRVGAASTTNALEPVAFENEDGRYAVIVAADGAATFSVVGLPAGTYGITYTTATATSQSLPDVTIIANQPLPVSIPARGVVSVYRR